MKLASLRTRILVGAVASAVIALVLVQLTIWLALDSSRGPRPEPEIPETLIQACRADPEAWTDVVVGYEWIRSYDAEGNPAVPGAAPLSAAPSHHVVRVADEGPCAVFEVHFAQDRAGFDIIFRAALLGGSFLAVLVVGLATYRFTLVPLLRRIERVRDAAVQVGGEGYVSGDDAVGDALAEIAAVLDASHERIQEDRAELLARHQALEKYMAELAHDLRTPLGSLLLALQEVRASVPGDSVQAVRRALTDASYVSALVENLHHAARLRHGLDPLDGTCDLTEVVSRLEVRFRALGEVEGVDVAAATPDNAVPVHCQPALAERALGNLLQNAVEHGGEHAAIVLRVRGDRFEIAVRDDGPGLAPERLADLAHRTFDTDPARPRGPGLGLAITNEVVRRAGWTIRYERGMEGGLDVIIEGPLV